VHKFSAWGNNFKKAQIFKNAFFRTPDQDSEIGINFFGIDFFNRYRNRIRTLTYEDCFTEIGFKTVQEFNLMGLPVSMVVWMRLRQILTRFHTNDLFPPSQGINDFFNRWKKGGRPIRRFFTFEREKNVNHYNSTSFATFARLTDTDPDPASLVVWCQSWTTYSLNNSLRNFIFNSRYNYLPLNNRLNAYIDDIDPSCTFCRLSRTLPPPRDSLAHCFLHCNLVNNLLIDLLQLLGIGTEPDRPEFKYLYWYGVKPNVQNINVNQIALNLVFDCFRYIIFNYRLRKSLPEDGAVLRELIHMICWIKKFNKKLDTAITITFFGTNFLQALG
jgi:hypothetical protein